MGPFTGSIPSCRIASFPISSSACWPAPPVRFYIPYNLHLNLEFEILHQVLYNLFLSLFIFCAGFHHPHLPSLLEYVLDLLFGTGVFQICFVSD